MFQDIGSLILLEVWWQGREIRVLSEVNQSQTKRSCWNVPLECKEIVKKVLMCSSEAEFGCHLKNLKLGSLNCSGDRAMNLA